MQVIILSMTGVKIKKNKTIIKSKIYKIKIKTFKKKTKTPKTSPPVKIRVLAKNYFLYFQASPKKM